jgi:hypothetical protein
MVVPWPVTEQIAAAAARRNPAPSWEAVHNEQNEARYRAVHGHWCGGRGATSPQRGAHSPSYTCVSGVRKKRICEISNVLKQLHP